MIVSYLRKFSWKIFEGPHGKNYWFYEKKFQGKNVFKYSKKSNILFRSWQQLLGGKNIFWFSPFLPSRSFFSNFKQNLWIFWNIWKHFCPRLFFHRTNIVVFAVRTFKKFLEKLNFLKYEKIIKHCHFWGSLQQKLLALWKNFLLESFKIIWKMQKCCSEVICWNKF